MKKPIITLSLLSFLTGLAGTAQPVEVHNPAASGLMHQIPYTTRWSQSFLTNNSGLSAIDWLFGDTNTAIALWEQMLPFTQVENTNALTQNQQNALNAVLNAGMTNGFLILQDMPDVIQGFSGVGDGVFNGIATQPLMAPNLVVPGATFPQYQGHGSLMVLVTNFIIGQKYLYTPGRYIDGQDVLGTSPDGVGMNNVVSYGGSFVAQQTSYYIAAPAQPVDPPSPDSLVPVTAVVRQIVRNVPVDFQSPTVVWNQFPSSLWTVQSADAGNFPQDGFVPTAGQPPAPNYIGAFEPNTFYDSIALWTPYGYINNGSTTTYALTNLWYVDKYGNQFTYGTNQAAYFVGNGSRLTGITCGQIGAVPVSDGYYNAIPGIQTTIASHSTAISALQANTSYPLNSAPYQTYTLTTLAPNYMVGSLSISGTPYVNTYGRRTHLYVNYTRKDGYSITLSNATTGMMLTHSNSVVVSIANAGAATVNDTMAGTGVIDMPASPGETIQIFVNALTNCTITRAYAVGE